MKHVSLTAAIKLQQLVPAETYADRTQDFPALHTSVSTKSIPTLKTLEFISCRITLVLFIVNMWHCVNSQAL